MIDCDIFFVSLNCNLNFFLMAIVKNSSAMSNLYFWFIFLEERSNIFLKRGFFSKSKTTKYYTAAAKVKVCHFK